MSEPVSKAEVEDVLSSIRKLVSDDAVAQAEVAPASVAPVLVLSEDAVIKEENQVNEAVEAVEGQPAAATDVSWNSSFIAAETPSEEADLVDVHPEVAVDAVAESAMVEEVVQAELSTDTAAVSEEFSENAAETAGDVVDFAALAEAPITEFAASEDPSEVAAFQRLEDKAAHMEAMVSGQSDDWETDGTELADLDVGNLSGFEVSAKPETADIYVLSQQEAVTDAPFVLEGGFSADTAPTAEAGPFILTAAALVAREDIVLGAGSITPEELTADGQEGAAAPVASDPAEAFAPDEPETEEQVAEPVAEAESEETAELTAEELVVQEETGEAEIEEEGVLTEDNSVVEDVETVEVVEEEPVDLPSAEIVEEELTDVLEAVESVSESAEPLAEEALMNEAAADEALNAEAVTVEAEVAETDVSGEAVAEEISQDVLPAVSTEAETAEPEVAEPGELAEVEATEATDAEALAVPPMDEEKLRELVAEVVRQELRGALGERITRNMRKMVRREIYRTVSSRDLEG